MWFAPAGNASGSVEVLEILRLSFSRTLLLVLRTSRAE